jgi:hypothetical protein
MINFGDTIKRLAEIAKTFSTDEVLWLKLSSGSGGDLVIRLTGNPPDINSIVNGIERLRGEFIRACESSGYSSQIISELWPAESYAPLGISTLLVRDATYIEGG